MDTILSTEAARQLGVNIKTLQRYDRNGLLKAGRTQTNRRCYTQEQLLAFRHMTRGPRKTVAYCRVSSQSQRPDLRNQRRILEEFCAARGIAGVEFVEEIGGGLNFKRKLFLKLVDEIGMGCIERLVIAHRDRLARFGFELLAHLCESHGCELLVLNNETHSPEQEMVEDLMTIVHCFSARLYGLRNYRKSLKAALKA